MKDLVKSLAALHKASWESSSLSQCNDERHQNADGGTSGDQDEDPEVMPTGGRHRGEGYEQVRILIVIGLCVAVSAQGWTTQ